MYFPQGVTITNDLSWKKHCQAITQKASRTLGLIRRTLYPCTKEVKTRAYKALVRPQLEYSSEAWNPHTKIARDRLEQIQKTAARFVQRDYRRTTSTTALVANLAWDTLYARRLLAQCTLFFKIQYKLVDISFPQTIIPANRLGRKDHSLKYYIPEATIDSYKFSFYPRTVRI